MSDSSSEDENISLLREAVDTDLIKDSMYSKSDAKAVEDVKPAKEQMKSLRNVNHEDDEQFSTFKVTPQFQSYVAKHLEKMLEESLTKQLKHYADDISPKKSHKKSRIKLLSDSKHCLKVTANGENDTQLVNRINATNAKRRINRNCGDSDEDLDRFRTVAISAERILAQTEVAHWAKRRKRQVYEYRQFKDGTLRNVENCK